MKSLIFLAAILTIASATTNEASGQVRAFEDGVINLSSAMSSNYAVVGFLIVGFLILDVLLGAIYFTDLAVQRRRNSIYRRHYQYPNVHHHGIGRLGAVDVDAAENSSEFAFQSLDVVDTTFGILNVETQACRERAICELERAATSNSVLSFLTENLNSYINGLEKYTSAIQSGRNGLSCEEIYAVSCPNSFVESWNLFKK